MKTRLATDDERLDDSVPATSSPTLGSSREAAPSSTTSTLRDAVETAANRSLIRLFPKFGAGRQPQLGQGRHQGPRWRARRARRRRPPRRANHATPCARRCSPRSAQVARKAPSSRSASLRRRSAGRRTPSAARSSPCSRPATSGPRRTARISPARRSCRRPRSARSRSTRRTNRRRVGQRLAVKGLLTAAGIAVRAGARGSAALGRSSSGSRILPAAPAGQPPLPEPPGHRSPRRTSLALGGNQRFRADRRRPRPPQRPTSNAGGRLISSGRSGRPNGTILQRLLRHADGLPIAAETVAPAVAAIRDGRQLLDDPDPIAPLLAELTAALRDEVTQRAEQLADGSARRRSPSSKPGTSGTSSTQPTARRSSPTPSSSRPIRRMSRTEAKLLEALDADPTERVARSHQPRCQPPRPGPPARRQAARARERHRHSAIRPRSRTSDDLETLRRGAARSSAASPRRQQDRDHLRPSCAPSPLHSESSSRRRCLAARRAAESASRAADRGPRCVRRSAARASRCGSGRVAQRLAGEVAPARRRARAARRRVRLRAVASAAVRSVPRREQPACCIPQYKAPVTLADCEELAAELGEPDGWSVAARFAAEILPGIFRLDDPVRAAAARSRGPPRTRADPRRAARRDVRRRRCARLGLPVLAEGQEGRGQRVGAQDRRRRPRPGDAALHRELHGPVPARELARRVVGGPAPRQPAGRRASTTCASTTTVVQPPARSTAGPTVSPR